MSCTVATPGKIWAEVTTMPSYSGLEIVTTTSVQPWAWSGVWELASSGVETVTGGVLPFSSVRCRLISSRPPPGSSSAMVTKAPSTGISAREVVAWIWMVPLAGIKNPSCSVQYMSEQEGGCRRRTARVFQRS